MSNMACNMSVAQTRQRQGAQHPAGVYIYKYIYPGCCAHAPLFCCGGVSAEITTPYLVTDNARFHGGMR